jgi:hypothetical protein
MLAWSLCDKIWCWFVEKADDTPYSRGPGGLGSDADVDSNIKI